MFSGLFKAGRRAGKGGFTLAETTVALAASSIVLGGLMMSMMSLRRTFSATESYSRAQAAQIRLIDAVAMDLRRATGVAITTSTTSNPAASGNTTARFAYSASAPASNNVTVQDGTYDSVNDVVGVGTASSKYLTLTLPGVYQSQNAASANYRKVTTLISTGRAVRYGTSAGVAADVTVQYRKTFVPAYGSECYVRREDGVDRVIVERADYMDLDIIAQEDGSFVVDAWFTPTYSNARARSNARVTSSDRVMLRNPRRD